MRYTEEELTSITQLFKGSQSQFEAGINVTATAETNLHGNNKANKVIATVNSNLVTYAAALSKNISDMFDLGESFKEFDEAQGKKNRQK